MDPGVLSRFSTVFCDAKTFRGDPGVLRLWFSLVWRDPGGLLVYALPIYALGMMIEFRGFTVCHRALLWATVCPLPFPDLRMPALIDGVVAFAHFSATHLFRTTGNDAVRICGARRMIPFRPLGRTIGVDTLTGCFHAATAE